MENDHQKLDLTAQTQIIPEHIQAVKSNSNPEIFQLRSWLFPE